MKKISFLVMLFCILLVYFISGYKRYDVYKKWEENRALYFVDNVTAMTTLDAYYWLKMARDLDNGKLGKNYIDPLKEYPDMRCYNKNPNMLVWMLSITHKITGLDYYKSGLLLIPFLAGIFLIPLFFYFLRLGYGEAAILGGLLGNFSYAYYIRSTMGRVDTDLLNIFFPVLVSVFFLFISKENKNIKNYIFTALAGIAMAGFSWWYQKPGFILVYFVFLIAYLLLQKFSTKELLMHSFIFLFFSNPLYTLNSFNQLVSFFNSYFFPKPTGQISWPDIMQTITESQKRDLIQTLKMIHGIWGFVIIGFAGLVYLYIKNFIKMIPITPIIILGSLSIVGSNRFAMYLAPFIGVGIGVIIIEVIKFIEKIAKFNKIFTSIGSISLMFIFFFSTVNYTAYSYVIRPSIDPDITKSFIDLKKILPKNSAVFTWWDFGYALMDIPEFATYHDGGAHGGLRTTLVAKGFTNTNQQNLYKLLAYLEEYGFDYLNEAIIKDNISADDMLKEIYGYNDGFKGENVYILYTRDMIKKFGAISFFGNWDFNEKKTYPTPYNELRCSKIENKTLYCEGISIDLDSGIATTDGNKFFLKRIVFVNNGKIVDKSEIKDTGYTLQLLMRNNGIFSIQLIPETLYASNFNQQYILGNYDKELFQEVYNNFPTARAFKVLRR